MADLKTLLSFAFTSFLIELTPGPNMTYLAILALARGKKAALRAVAGVALGLALVGLAAVAGLGELVARSPALYGALRWGGVLFLVYLAYDGWRSAEATEYPQGDREFLRGLLTNLLNPKAAVFFLAVLPTFMNPERSAYGQSLALTAVYVGVATGIHLAIVLLASHLQPWLSNSRVNFLLRRALSLALVGVAGWLFFTTKA